MNIFNLFRIDLSVDYRMWFIGFSFERLPNVFWELDIHLGPLTIEICEPLEQD